jgi:hypothetical protein
MPRQGGLFPIAISSFAGRGNDSATPDSLDREAAALVTAFGFALGIFVYPFWLLRDVATEELAPATREKFAQELPPPQPFRSGALELRERDPQSPG